MPLFELYILLKKTRMLEERMISFQKQGKLSKWFSGIGQEAISVGATLAINKNEYILPAHRNLGVFISRDIPIEKLFAQFLAKQDGFTNGRDRSFHFGSKDHHIVGMISHLAAQLPLAVGMSLADVLSNKKRVTITILGEGASSLGDFHEALNMASVWNLPVIFIIENNQYGLSTPTKEQYNCKKLSDRALGYGIEGVTINGNDVIDVYSTIKSMADSIRENPRPILIECKTFRIRSHEESLDNSYVPNDEIYKWQQNDPISNIEKLLATQNIQYDINDILNNFSTDIDQAFDYATKLPNSFSNIEQEEKDIFSDFKHTEYNVDNLNSTNLRFIDAINSALNQALQKHPNLVLLGQDIAEFGGVFKVTQGLVDSFGKARIRNTPIAESATIGAALGLAINDMKAIVEIQFGDFISNGFNQIVNNLAKSYYRWKQNADVVIRVPAGAGNAAGPFHSQTNEAWFLKTPGLKVVYPAFPDDAKGLLLSAIEDPNPVLFFEHKDLYRKITSTVPENYFTIPIGKAKLISQGTTLSIITYGMGVHWALNEISQLPDISIDLLDLRTIQPWDKEAVENTVKKTGKVIILHEDTLTCGLGAEISAYISQHLFIYLDAPIVRCASLDTPIPSNKNLENQFLANSRLKQSILDLAKF